MIAIVCTCQKESHPLDTSATKQYVKASLEGVVRTLLQPALCSSHERKRSILPRSCRKYKPINLPCTLPVTKRYAYSVLSILDADPSTYPLFRASVCFVHALPGEILVSTECLASDIARMSAGKDRSNPVQRILQTIMPIF